MYTRDAAQIPGHSGMTDAARSAVGLSRGTLLSLFAGALLLKAVVLFLLLPGLADTVAPHHAIGYADDYDVLADSLANGQGYRLGSDLPETMMREPGYPIFLAGVFKLFGNGIAVARSANLLLAGAIALMLWWLARRVTADAAVPIIAPLLFLFHPGIVIAEARGGVEMLFICATVAFLLLVYRAIATGTGRDYLYAGLALGLVVSIRSTPILFPVVLLPYLLLTAASARERLRRAMCTGLLVLGMGIVMLPWVVRNYALVGEFVPTATVQGVAAQEGQYTCERASFGRRFQALQTDAAQERNRFATDLGLRFRGDYYQYFYTPADELAFNQALRERTVQRYRDSPALFLQCAAANVLNFWFLGKDGLATAMNIAVQLPLLLLALAGGYLLWRGQSSRIGVIVLFVFYVVAVHAPVIAHARHSIPLVPLLSVFASAALLALWRRFFSGPRPISTLP
jgi:4-amino-4-deoxy-L-arabinose transferase-like glycosyltransferase